MDEEAIQARIDAAVAAALEAAAAAIPAPIPAGIPAPGAGPAAAGPPAAAGDHFARTPAQAKDGIINYGTSDGMKLYNAAVQALATKYSGKAGDMHLFLKAVGKRVQKFGWDRIVNIPVEDGSTRNLLEQYGLISLSAVRAHAQTYESIRGRDAQNASQMFDFLEESLSEEAKLMVLSDFDDYTIMTPGGIQIGNGPSFLKVIVRNTTVDTRSTVFHIRENLNHLPSKMLELSYDIEAFNLYVTSQVEQLSARGEVSSDLVIQLFLAFKAVPDKKFNDFIERQRDRYDDGKEVTVKHLMQVALTKYLDRKRADEWQSPSIEAEQIMALTARIDAKENKPNPAPSAEKGKKGNNKKGEKKKARDAKEAKFAEKYAWKLIPPAEGEAKTKEVNSKVYHFCPHHHDGKGAWVIHHPSKCDKREVKKDKPHAKDSKILSLSKALQAIHEETGDVTSDEEDE